MKILLCGNVLLNSWRFTVNCSVTGSQVSLGIWVSFTGEDVNYGILDCDAVQSCWWLPQKTITSQPRIPHLTGLITFTVKVIGHTYIAKTSEKLVFCAAHALPIHHLMWGINVWFLADILHLRRVVHHLPVTDQAIHLNQHYHRATHRTITLSKVAFHPHVSLLHSNNLLQLLTLIAKVLPTVDLHRNLATSEEDPATRMEGKHIVMTVDIRKCCQNA